MKMERFAKRNKIVAEIIFKETNYTDWRNSSRHVKESYILYYVYSKICSDTGTGARILYSSDVDPDLF